MTQAVGDRASDVHIEPTEHDVRDPVPRRRRAARGRCRSPKNIQGGLISRLKVMADLNIAEKRIPQDGRDLDAGGRQGSSTCGWRTLPTVYGEKVVIRDAGQDQRPAPARGARVPAQDAFDRFSSSSFRKPYGAILVTGPTGSGKSTTMYATLNILNQSRQEHHHASRTRSSTGSPA